MDERRFSTPLDLRKVKITDPFWTRETELVRTEVIPYQWNALNDRVPGAAPSYCMHNFRAAGRLIASGEIAKRGNAPDFLQRAFDKQPEDPAHPDPDSFYGFVFQDTDFSKWIEAVGYSLTAHPDPELERIADGAIDVVCAAQTEDGYLDTRYIIGGMDRRFTNLKEHHELYNLGHLIEGAVAYYQATGKRKLLDAAARFADYTDTRIGPEEGKLHGYPGHEIAEMALIRLWEATGEERYLRLARYFVDERGKEPNFFSMETERRRLGGEHVWDFDPAYHQAGAPVREQQEAVGHAVRAMYLYSGMADVARLTQDDSLLAACERLWRSTVEEKMYITGGVGGTREGEAFSFPFDLPNDAAYSETCAAIGLVFFARRMLQIRADSRYGDAMELALYNTVLDGMALDGKSFFYVNPLEVVPEAAHSDKRLSHVKPIRQKWFGCACCPPNIARLVSSLGAYAVTAGNDTVWYHLYTGTEVQADLNGTPVTLVMESELPWQGKARLTVHAAAPAQGTLAFRLPGWCDAPSVTSKGKAERTETGYLYLTGTWQEGDTVTIDLPMRIRAMRANSLVRECAGQTAVTRGPIVYCGEEADNGVLLHQIHVDPARIGEAAFELDETTFAMPTGRVTLPAERVTSTAAALYSEWHPEERMPVTLRLIPYFTFANRGEGEMRVWWH